MSDDFTRRSWLAGLASGVAIPSASGGLVRSMPKETFGYCLNTSTVRTAEGKSRPIVELVNIAEKAGYQAIEPWIGELDEYLKGGGSFKDLRNRIADAGLAVPNAIGFAEWIVEDSERRKKGLEQAKRDMDWVQQIGGKRLAAPPVGATGGTSKRDDPNFTLPIINMLAAADRYRELLALGKSMGITPIVEVWGFSKTLSRLGETLLVAAECGSPEGCVLPDVYHLYKGGSDFAGLHLLSSSAIGIFHVNDYPPIERGKITDADRVFPGDGIAPLKEIFGTLRTIGYRGFVSLELFNRGYWKQDPLKVATMGLRKMKAAAE